MIKAYIHLLLLLSFYISKKNLSKEYILNKILINFPDEDLPLWKENTFQIFLKQEQEPTGNLPFTKNAKTLRMWLITL